MDDDKVKQNKVKVERNINNKWNEWSQKHCSDAKIELKSKRKQLKISYV